jgi:hypothetical protein
VEPFISVDDLNAFMEGTLTGGELMTGIALDSACQMVRDYLEQDVNLVRDDIELHDGTGRESLLLRQLPVIEVTLVEEDSVVLVADTDYILWGGRGGTLWRAGGQTIPSRWSKGRQNVEVIYDHGYAITPDEVVETSEGIAVDLVPSSIRLAALEAAARIIRAPSLAAVASGITGETLGAYSYTASLGAVNAVIAGGLLAEERITLDRYKPGGRS